MKKRWIRAAALLMSAALCAGLWGCAPAEEADAPEQSTPAQEQSAPPEQSTPAAEQGGEGPSA